MRNLRAVGITTLIIWFALCLASSVMSQTATTSLRGTVTDASGAVIAGAQLVLSNPSTGYSRLVKTDSQGAYEFVDIPPATYELTITASGFASFRQANLVLVVATPATLNASLQVASASQSVEVTSQAPLINTVDSSQGHAFNTVQIENLPFEGRDPTAILSLQSGVVYTGSNAAQNTTFDSRSGAVAGARSDQANITIDGFDNNNPLQGLPFQGSLRSTLDSLQEFRVTTTAGSAADAGYSSGAQVTLVTKSGTNQFHGSLYEYNRPTNTVANDYFNKLAEAQAGLPNAPGRLLRNTFGGSIDGPILRDRLFFFYTYEGQRQRESVQVTRLVPSANMRNGILTYQSVSGPVTLTPANLAMMDPNCSTPSPGFPQGTCPLGPGANPAVEDVLKMYPMPNALNVGDGYNIVGYSFSGPAPVNLNTNIARLDYRINADNQIFIRGNLQQDRTAGPPQFSGDPPNTLTTANPRALAVGYTALLGSNLANNFRYEYLRQGLASNGLQNQPYVSWDKMSSLQGETPTIIEKIPVHNLGDDLTWTKGSHTLQFGGSVLFINSFSSSSARSFSGAVTNPNALFLSAIANTGMSLDPGAFGFSPVDPSYSSNYNFAAITLTGLIPLVTATYNLNKQGNQLDLLPQGAFVTRNYHSNEAEWYAQDAWRVTPNLTLTFGARYTLLQPPYETHGNQVAPTMSMNEFFRQRQAAMNQGLTYTPLVGFDFSGQANGKAPYWNWDYGNIAPRIAFAWSPSWSDGLIGRLAGGAGKTSIRGGYGIYYDHFGQGVVDTFDTQGSFGLSTSTIGPPLGVVTIDQTPRFTGINDIPTDAAGGCPSPPCQIFASPPSGVLPYFPPSSTSNGGFAITWGLDDRLKTPYSEIASFSIQRQLPKNLVFEISYIGRFGHRLLQEEDLAMPLDIRDPKSGTDYFSAAKALDVAKQDGVPIQSIGAIPFWENIFPGAAGQASTQLYGAGFGPCAPHSGAPIPGSANVTATQAMYNMWSCNPPGSDTVALFNADIPVFPTATGCFPACATISGKQTQGYAFFDPQFSSLYAWRSIGNSNYHGLLASLRGRMNGLVFDLNYAYSKSMDYGSNAEYINEFQGAGFADQVVNAWNPKQNYGPSDFDLRHQINANWVYDLPWGAGRHWAMKGVADVVLGGWQTTGLFRWSSGFPFSILPGTLWATNWQLTQPVVPTGPLPETGSFLVNGLPNAFKDGPAAANDFRLPFPGEAGPRNALRGPGLFDIDAGLLKTWSLTESKKLIFGWQVYNVTNTPKFDVGSMSTQNGLCYCGNNTLTSASSFGNFASTLSKPRVMEFSLRFAF
ncbi:MAG TPA: carboxypeptidase-like regulatory domain-containing protein [Candidatus Acidoferrales bacterium]|nr:carboxypeptidase-like regulatory domain-containing protein [Candidatus Acidoferrales bacterium]